MRSSRLPRAAALWLAVVGLGTALAAQHGQQGGTAQQPRTVETKAAAPPAPPPTGVISGRVTANGRPVPRARIVIESHAIFACPPATPPEKSAGCPRYNRWVLTDADGRYSVTELPRAEDFVITATKTGFAPRSFGETPPEVTATPVALKDAELRPNVDIALVEDHRVSGSVVDTDGTPLAGALVQIHRSRLVNGQRQLVVAGDASTDDRGLFTIGGLATGQYVLSALDPTLANVGNDTGRLEYAPTFHPGTVHADEATRIDITDGAPITGLKIQLQIVTPAQAIPPAPTAVIKPPAAPVKGKPAPVRPAPPLTPPSATITGRITSLSDGRPLARARVMLQGSALFACAPGTPLDQTDTCPRFTRWTLTDQDGKYRFGPLPRAKDYVVVVVKSGYAARAFGETPPAVPPAYVELKDGEQKTAIDVALAPQNYVTGLLLDEDDTPIAGTLVEAQRAFYDAGQRRFISAASAVTDDAGRFRLSGLPPGQYFVTAFDPSLASVGDQKGQLFYGPTFYPGTVYQDDATRITLDPGIPVLDLKFKLQIIRPARVTGKIATGSELILLAGAVNMGPIRNQKVASFAIAEADIKPDGIFQFANILAERYIIRTRGEVERSTTDKQALSHFAQYSLPIQGQDEANINMTLVPGAEVKGRVTWEGRTTKPPVDQSTIRVRAPMADGSTFGDALTGVIDIDRNFYLRGVMTGSHMIRVEGLPEPWRIKKVYFRGADITDIAIDMESRTIYDGFDVVLTDVNTSLSGTVSVASGDLPQAYGVVIFSSNRTNWMPNSRFIRITYLDDRARWGTRGLPPGEYYIAVTRSADESDLTNPDLLESLARSAQLIRLAEGERRSLGLIAPDPRRRVAGGGSAPPVR